MKISVALCTYNGLAHLPRQLASIAAQRRLPDELVVRDDGSDDGSVEVLQAFAASAPFPVRLDLSGPRLGSIYNFERVIATAGGDVIALADQDDVWFPDKLEALEVAFATDPKLLVAFSDAHLIDADDRVLSDSVWRTLGFHEQARGDFAGDPLRVLLGRAVVAGCTLALRVDARRMVLPFPTVLADAYEQMHHDRWISLVAAAADRIAALDQPLLGYRVHDAQQLGIRGMWLRRLLHPSVWRLVALTLTPEERDRRHGSRVAQLAALAERLGEHPGVAAPDRLAEIAECSRHLAARAGLPQRRLARLRTVRTEWGRGGYQAWSLGALSAVTDLVR